MKRWYTYAERLAQEERLLARRGPLAARVRTAAVRRGQAMALRRAAVDDDPALRALDTAGRLGYPPGDWCEQ